MSERGTSGGRTSTRRRRGPMARSRARWGGPGRSGPVAAPPAGPGRWVRPRTPRRPGRVLGGSGGRPSVGSSRDAVADVPSADELRLLAELLAAGVPLLTSLTTLAGQSRSGRRRSALERAAGEVASGGRAAPALGRGSPNLTALLDAGERVGRLAESAAAAADLEERLLAVRRRIASALAYPALVLLVAGVVVLILLTTVVPEVEATFRDLGGELPRATRLVVGASRLLAGPTPWVTAAVLATAAGLQRRGRRGPTRDRSRRALPGSLGRHLDVAVGARVIATLLSNGVPLATALDTAAGGVARADVADALRAVADRIARGGRLADASELGGILPDADRVVLAVGEERGLLAAQWARVADRRLHALERRLDVVGTLAEPLLVLVVGATVGAVVTALYLPSFRVLELL